MPLFLSHLLNVVANSFHVREGFPGQPPPLTSLWDWDIIQVLHIITVQAADGRHVVDSVATIEGHPDVVQSACWEAPIFWHSMELSFAKGSYTTTYF